MFYGLACRDSMAWASTSHWRGFHRRRSGVKVSTGSREAVAQQAHQLRRIAGFLAESSAPAHWRGPAERESSRQIQGLEEDLRDVARALAGAAEYAGIHSVMARL